MLQFLLNKQQKKFWVEVLLTSAEILFSCGWGGVYPPYPSLLIYATGYFHVDLVRLF